MNAQTAKRLESSSHTSVSSARPFRTVDPTGRCIHEFATMMNSAESHEPSAASQIVARWSLGERRFQPKIQRPRNVDSRKNAASPSIASGAPKTSPTYFEYTAQFIPNWNSCTRPVATPIAKLINISVPKKRVNRSHATSPVRYQIVCITATNGASPSVSGTKRKWYSDVVANWIRARSTVVEASGLTWAWNLLDAVRAFILPGLRPAVHRGAPVHPG